MKLGNCLLNCFVLSAAVVVCFFIGELGLRIFYPVQLPFKGSKGMYILDEAVEYRLAPNFEARVNTAEFSVRYRVNSNGMRGPEQALDAGGAARVLMLGDSFLYGYGCPENELASVKLEKLLNRNLPARKWMVMNSGAPGYSTCNERAHLEKYFDRLRPDIVILFFYVGNDLLGNMEFGKNAFSIEGGYIKRTLAESVEKRIRADSPFKTRFPFKTYIVIHSHLYNFVVQRLHSAMLSAGVPGMKRRHSQLLAKDFLFNYAVEPPEKFSAAWEKTKGELDRMKSFCDRKRVPFLVIFTPQDVQVNPALWKAALKQSGLRPREADARKANRLLADYCAQRGIGFTDPTETMAARNAKVPMHHRQDRHFTPAGHSVMAESIMKLLKSKSAVTESKL